MSPASLLLWGRRTDWAWERVVLVPAEEGWVGAGVRLLSWDLLTVLFIFKLWAV